MKVSIKQLTGKTFDVEVKEDATVLDIKKMCFEKLQIEPELQRLIYKGRVLQDNKNLKEINFKEGDQIILVKGNKRRQAERKEQQASTAATPTTAPPQPTSQPTGAQPQANLFGSGGGVDGSFIRTIFESNPNLRSILDANPQLRHALSDPNTLRQAMNMVTNPDMMMRSNDAALRNIESRPGGFNALSRMYNNVQAPMQNALSGLSPATSTNLPDMSAQQTPVDSPMPNPFANNSSGGSGNPAANASPLSAFGFGGLESFGGLDPQSLQRNRAVLHQLMQNPQLQRMMTSPEFVESMLNSSPALRQMVSSNPHLGAVMRNPEAIRAMLNPQRIAAMNQLYQSLGQPAPAANTQPASTAPSTTASTTQNTTSTTTTNSTPSTASAPTANTQPAQPAAQPNLAALLLPFMTAPAQNTGQATGQSTAPTSSIGQAPASTGQAPQNPYASGGAAANPLAALFNPMMGLNPSAMGAMGGLGGLGAAAVPQLRPEELYRVQLSQLEGMGFTNRERNIQELQRCGGNVQAAVERLLGS